MGLVVIQSTYSRLLYVVRRASTESISEKAFIGNGEWPVGPAASVSPESISIPSPPLEGVDHAPKMVYKMSSKPRGIGNIFV